MRVGIFHKPRLIGEHRGEHLRHHKTKQITFVSVQPIPRIRDKITIQISE